MKKRALLKIKTFLSLLKFIKKLYLFYSLRLMLIQDIIAKKGGLVWLFT